MKCKAENCNRKSIAKKSCMKHYMQLRRLGTYKQTNYGKFGLNSPNASYHYTTLWDMKRRCYNPNYKTYKYYGGRGIKICDRWTGKDGLENFIQDMGTRPQGYSIDRIDNDGDYTPENCRWATRLEQNQNKRYLFGDGTSKYLNTV